MYAGGRPTLGARPVPISSLPVCVAQPAGGKGQFSPVTHHRRERIYDGVPCGIYHQLCGQGSQGHNPTSGCTALLDWEFMVHPRDCMPVDAAIQPAGSVPPLHSAGVGGHANSYGSVVHASKAVAPSAAPMPG